MLVVLFGASGVGKTSLVKELELKEEFIGEVSHSPIRDAIEKGILPNPRISQEVPSDENILNKVEEYLFQNGLTAFLYAVHTSLAKVYLGRCENLIVMDRSFIDTFPYYGLRLGKAHPYEEILMSRFLEISDLVIHVSPHPGHVPRYKRHGDGKSDVEEFENMFIKLKNIDRGGKVVCLDSPTIEGRVKELLDYIDRWKRDRCPLY